MRISDWSSDVCSSDLSSHDRRPTTHDRSNAYLAYSITLVSRSTVTLIWPGYSSSSSIFLEIGRASCRERVCQYVSISVVAVSLKKKYQKIQENTYINQKRLRQEKNKYTTKKK